MIAIDQNSPTIEIIYKKKLEALDREKHYKKKLGIISGVGSYQLSLFIYLFFGVVIPLDAKTYIEDNSTRNHVAPFLSF